MIKHLCLYYTTYLRNLIPVGYCLVMIFQPMTKVASIETALNPLIPRSETLGLALQARKTIQENVGFQCHLVTNPIFISRKKTQLKQNASLLIQVYWKQ